MGGGQGARGKGVHVPTYPTRAPEKRGTDSSRHTPCRTYEHKCHRVLHASCNFAHCGTRERGAAFLASSQKLLQENSSRRLGFFHKRIFAGSSLKHPTVYTPTRTMAALALEALPAAMPELEAFGARFLPSLASRAAPSLEASAPSAAAPGTSWSSQLLPLLFNSGGGGGGNSGSGSVFPVQRVSRSTPASTQPKSNTLLWVGVIVGLALVGTLAAFLIMNSSKASSSVPMAQATSPTAPTAPPASTVRNEDDTA